MLDAKYWNMLIKRSISRFFLLHALHHKPRHGYEIGKFIKEACDGCCEPTDAAIYPTLHELLEGGYIECREEIKGGKKRKVCALTEKGQNSYRLAAESWRKVIPYLSEATGLVMDKGKKKEDSK